TSYVGAAQPTDEGWACTPNALAGASCTKTVTVAAAASASFPFTVRVQSPLEGALAIENTVKSSDGVCLTCTVTNPTTANPTTTKTGREASRVPANVTTQIPAGTKITYQIAVANNGGTAGAKTPTADHTPHTSDTRV